MDLKHKYRLLTANLIMHYKPEADGSKPSSHLLTIAQGKSAVDLCNLKSAGYSSVGRAIDCRSIGRVFNSHCPDLTWI